MYRSKTAILALTLASAAFAFGASANAASQAVSNDSAEVSAIVKYDSAEVRLKNSQDCRNAFKSTFIRKVSSIADGSEIGRKRFERLKKEIAKLRERTTHRIEKIDDTVSKLAEEKKQLTCIIRDIDSVEARFVKLRLVDDDAPYSSTAEVKAAPKGRTQ